MSPRTLGADNTLTEPIPLPGLVAGELSISAGGSMVAMTVQSPSMPRTVELVDPRTRQWQSIDREPSRGPVASWSAARPAPQMITARWAESARVAVPAVGE